MKKVHLGLTEVVPGETYHLGYYEVDFPDGALVFQCHTMVCDIEGCPCDEIRIDWLAEESFLRTWFTAEREWLDGDHQPLHEDVLGVLRIVEGIETFRERYHHLMFLRRRQVLSDRSRMEPNFQVKIPVEFLLTGAEPQQEIMGRTAIQSGKGERALAWWLEFCSDSDCFCNHIFLAYGGKRDTKSVCIDEHNEWQATNEEAKSIRYAKKLKRQLAEDERFVRLLNFMRTERRLHNYHRFVMRHDESGHQLPVVGGHKA